jgi:hypothetical protein
MTLAFNHGEKGWSYTVQTSHLLQYDPLRNMHLHDGWFASSTNKGAVVDASFCC